MGTSRGTLIEGRGFSVVAVILVGVRFIAPSFVAAMGVQGLDTSALDALIFAYDAAVPAVATLLVALMLFQWPGARAWDRWYGLSVLAVAGSLVFWVGEVDPGARIVTGAWSGLPLAVSVSAAILLVGRGLDARMGRARTEREARTAFRSLYVTFAVVYLLGGLRFIDYRVAVGAALPSGVLWALDYTPTLLPCFVAIVYWFRCAIRLNPIRTGVVRTFGLPVMGAAAGVGVAQGLGGFILANVLAWGGGYEVFVPTAIGLAFVGFSVGAFLATAWVLRGRLPAPAWRLAFSGVCVTALAGILFFDAALASLAGICLGLVMVAQSLDASNLPRS